VNSVGDSNLASSSSVQNHYIISTITSLPDNLSKERLNAFLINLNHFDLKRLYIIRPMGDCQIKGDCNNL